MLFLTWLEEREWLNVVNDNEHTEDFHDKKMKVKPIDIYTCIYVYGKTYDR